uniref:Uncharacterized protein n=1 Tax=Tetraselmis chuii TaxID=63592 RepID=A0A7S1SNW1_9CHLO|mmetsp:Transcript_17688/g.31537  ORF Transcript_17688/g.31537 Transcript_17688/m.31537 type:complete len:116 (+) Transcript_17688:52-399(+)
MSSAIWGIPNELKMNGNIIIFISTAIAKRRYASPRTRGPRLTAGAIAPPFQFGDHSDGKSRRQVFHFSRIIYSTKACLLSFAFSPTPFLLSFLGAGPAAAPLVDRKDRKRGEFTS